MEKNSIVLFALVTLLLLGNLYMSFQLLRELEEIKQTAALRKPLPCESVPLRWAVVNYNCANSLLAAMNVTNVRFEAPPAAYERSMNTSGMS